LCCEIGGKSTDVQPPLQDFAQILQNDLKTGSKAAKPPKIKENRRNFLKK